MRSIWSYSTKAITAAVAIVLAAASPLRAQCPDGTPPPCAPRRPPPAPTSVAVLTFDNRSHDSADVFLAEGLADEIAARLTQVGRLTVASRAQVRRLRGVERMSIPDVGRALNVANLVTGGLQRSGSRLRVNVELLRAGSAQQVWADVLDRSTTDLLEIQAAVASAVAAAIAGRLAPQEQRALA